MKIKNALAALFGTIMVVLLVLIYIQLLKKDRIYYIETPVLYNEFALKKEMQEAYDRVIRMRENQTDSLQSLKASLFEEIKNLDVADDQKEAIWQEQSNHVDKRLEEIRELNIRLTQEYEEKIWKQLNAYIEEYRAEKDIDLLFGAMGDGHLMAADEDRDMTEELIEYVNKKYNGE